MSAVTEIEKLLTEVKGIVEKYKKVDEMTGKNFNIFKVCEIDEKEVLICRFIYQLINPKGLHNQGDIFLRKFIIDVLGGEISEDEMNTIVVKKEKVIKVHDYMDNSLREHRIDLLITTNKRVIPIEVKIYANDQEHQCGNYSKWAKEQKKDDYSLYYLTLDGQVPSSYSVAYDKDLDDYAINKELNDKYRIKCISFKNEIVPWIEDCIKDINVIDKKQILDNLMQFLNVVRGLCNMSDNELNDELKNVLENSKNFEAYIEMTKCQSEITSYVLETIIFKLHEWAKEKNFRVDDTYEKYKEEIKNLCGGKNIGDKRPGFGVECKNQIDGCILCVAIEAGKTSEGMWYGIYIKNSEKWKGNISYEIKKKLELNTEHIDNIWVCRDSMKNNIGVPNFVEPNEAFAKLLGENELDTSRIDSFVNDIQKKLGDLIDKIEGFKK